MKSAKKGIFGAVATVAAAGAMVLGGAAAANAIDRVSCTDPTFLWMQSTETTCWANAGGTSVTLYDVYGLNSGNNDGWFSSPSGGFSFDRNNSYIFSPRTVTYIYIN